MSSDKTMNDRLPYRIMHISAARYKISDDSHSTYLIWKNLVKGFSEYHVFARADGVAGEEVDGALHLHFIPSLIRRELEFLASQFFALSRAKVIKPDVIIAQSPVLGGIAGAIIAARFHIPLLVELHGMEFVDAHPKSLKNRFIQRLASFIYPRADVIRVLSVKMKEDLLKKYPNLNSQKVWVLPPRADLSIFRPRLDWSINGPVTVTMLGAINENKGQVRAIRAFLECNLRIRLCLIGDGPDIEKCRDLSLTDTGCVEISVLGRLSPQEVAIHLYETDIFLMNSRSEGTPRALMEAMAMARPVITTDAGYCSDLVDHMETGVVLANERTEKDLVYWVNVLANDYSFRKKLGLAALDKAKNQFDSVKNFTKYRSMIAELVLHRD